MFSQKSPMFSQKSPMFPQKSPMFSQKSPMFSQKSHPAEELRQQHPIVTCRATSAKEPYIVTKEPSISAKQSV